MAAGDHEELVLPPGSSGRLDAALAQLLHGHSRRALKQAFREGRVRVAGRPARAADPATPGSQVTLRALPAAAAARPASEIELVPLFCDAALLAFDKPAGVPAAPRAAGDAFSFAAAVLARYPELAGVGDLPLAPGLCHRLDTETSGVLLFARSDAAFTAVRDAFRGRRVEKVYLALVAGTLAGEGVVDVPLCHAGPRGGMMVPVARRGEPQHARAAKAWPARTRWRALAERPLGTLVELVLETGVTHQARVHMAQLGHPIAGDPRYGGPAAPRLCLHARRLGLPHPHGGAWVSIESERQPF